MDGNRRAENLRGSRAVERAGLSPAPCRSSDVCTRFYSLKTQGNISLRLGPAFQCYLQSPNLSLLFFPLLALVGSFALGRVTHSTGIRGCDFEECSHFQHNPTPALQGVQEHSSAPANAPTARCSQALPRAQLFQSRCVSHLQQGSGVTVTSCDCWCHGILPWFELLVFHTCFSYPGVFQHLLALIVGSRPGISTLCKSLSPFPLQKAVEPNGFALVGRDDGAQICA